MKKTLLLMGVLVSFLSCQKDTDKACPYLNTTEKHVNDLGVPIQTCGETATLNYGAFYLCSTTDPQEMNPLPMETQYYNLGHIDVYHDAEYLYAVLDDGENPKPFELIIYPEGINAPLSLYKRKSSNSMIKVPLSEFNAGETVVIDPSWNTGPGESGYYNGYTYSCIELAFFHELDGFNVVRKFTYKITSCCNPDE